MKDYIWTIPLIAGILLLISWFTPAAYYKGIESEEYFWMWGLWYTDSITSRSNTGFFLLEEPAKYMIPIFLSGIFSAIIILIGSIVLIISANSIRTGRKTTRDFASTWFGMSIIIFVAAIIYIIGIDITLTNLAEWVMTLLPPDSYSVPDFWDFYNPGFALIAPFLSGTLVIVGIAVSKYISKRPNISLF